MLPKQLPKRLGIIGSGAIGIEFASFYNDLEVKLVFLRCKTEYVLMKIMTYL